MFLYMFDKPTGIVIVVNAGDYVTAGAQKTSAAMLAHHQNNIG